MGSDFPEVQQSFCR